MKKIIIAMLLLALVCGGAMAEALGTRMKVVNCNEWITLREDPSKKADSLAQMPLNSENLILLDEDFGDFTKLYYDGQIGYALKKYLDVAETYTGEELSLDEEQRYNVNVFLSNFSEQYFVGKEGYYTVEDKDLEAAVDFAINHIWFNKQNQLEKGEWDEFNVRLSANKTVATAEKYLNLEIKDQKSDVFTLKDGYYYWEETGGHVNDGFVCYDKVEKLDETRVGVHFRVYGAGEQWKNKDCYLTPEEVQQKYWCTQEGHAVINLDGGDLDDRSSWYLERYVIRSAE